MSKIAAGDGLEFGFSDLLAELRVIENLASEDFLDASARNVFGQFSDVLETLRRSSADRVASWELPEHAPLRTRPSTSYARSAREVWGEITARWRIKPVGTFAKAQAKRSAKAANRAFRLADEASTVVRLFSRDDDGEAHEIAMWRAEIGDASSPGCFFHVQIRGRSTEQPFPDWLRIPRLPALVPTPPAVVEFMLSELFQDRWSEALLRNDPAVREWQAIQRRRLKTLLTWHLEQIEETEGSPWVNFKLAKPDREMFVP